MTQILEASYNPTTKHMPLLPERLPAAQCMFIKKKENE
jgi:hypothetical protein